MHPPDASVALRATIFNGSMPRSRETHYGRLALDLAPLRGEVQALKSNPRRVPLVLVKSFFYATLLGVYAVRRAARRGSKRELCFHPQIPDAEYTMWKVCALLGFRRKPLGPDVKTVYVFDDNDDEPERLPDLPSTILGTLEHAINLRCTDISKTTVTRAFEEVFGYAVALDPTTHRGPLVVKSEGNAQHDGRVVVGPVSEVSSECVYQRLIDNEHSRGWVEDVRIPVVGRTVPFVYLKYRRVENRFANENVFVQLRRCEDVLSDEEVAGVLEVCRRLGLDCGEVDAVRERVTARLYILDVNKTCWGPPNHLPLLDCYRATWRLAQAFKKTYLTAEADPVGSGAAATRSG